MSTASQVSIRDRLLPRDHETKSDLLLNDLFFALIVRVEGEIGQGECGVSARDVHSTLIRVTDTLIQHVQAGSFSFKTW